MTAYVLDVENTTTTHHGKLHLDPFEPSNSLTMVGITNAENGATYIYTLDHAEQQDETGSMARDIQDTLDACTLLIMHNAQHDLMWLWESGFKYDGPIYDTMLGEYVLLRGLDEPLSLEALAIKHRLPVQKQDTLKEYFKQGLSTRDIPLAELKEYLSHDLEVTRLLYHKQQQLYAKPDAHSLHKIRDVTMDTCITLTRMYCNGFAVDMDALQEVKAEFEQEMAEIEDRLNRQVRNLMGDTPINLNSPEQMSQVIFSRAINNKKEWAALFEHTKTDSEFKQAVSANSKPVYKTQAKVCPECHGKKYITKTKKDGTPFAKQNKCPTCASNGFLLHNTKELAGLKFSAPNKSWVSANGFSTSKDNLTVLIGVARQNNMKEAEEFLTDLQRLSAVSSYLSSFVGGIEAFTKPDGLLHVGLTQHITATGRFSGRNPNMQNMPRGGTFPVKKAFKSRWQGGYVMEADFAQLEFRVAAFLAQDELAMHEVCTGFDVHSYTAKVITDAGEPTTRQQAKAHTFAPLYGATGHGRTAAQAAYYSHFTEKYTGIAAWHKALGDEAIRFEKVTTPSGRQYAFPNVYRRKNGTVSDFTRIKNYPVQGFATGDIVPVVLIEFERRLKPYKSCLVNTVHDSIVVDVHPDEKDIVIDIVKSINDDLHSIIFGAYGVDFNVPLLLEPKIGPNWLDTKDVK
jgi:DNA polymerase-1